MLDQSVEQIRFDFFPRLPISVETRDVQVSSDVGAEKGSGYFSCGPLFLLCMTTIPPVPCGPRRRMGSLDAF